MEPDNTSAGANDLFIIYVYSLLYIYRYTVTKRESLSFKSSESSTELSLQGTQSLLGNTL